VGLGLVTLGTGRLAGAATRRQWVLLIVTVANLGMPEGIVNRECGTVVGCVDTASHCADLVRRWLDALLQTRVGQGRPRQ